jgi:hypothetical protein
MAYEVFERKTPRLGIPTLTFTKMGQIAFNQPAARILKKAGFERVLLLWDSTEKKLALKATGNETDVRAYKIRFNEKGNGASFSAKTFLDHVGIDYAQRVPMQAHIDPDNELFLEVSIPEKIIKTNGLKG